MVRPPVQIYEFGSYRLDVGERLLLKDGAPVALTPKAFDILRVLVLRAGRLVSKEELIEEVWPDSFIEESNLARNVYVLRKTLGERADGQPYIQTVPRQGYRFVAEVMAVEVGAADSGVGAGEAAAEAAPVADAAATGDGGPRPAATTPRRRRGARLIANRFSVGLLLLLAVAAALYLLVTAGGRPEPDVRVRSLAILPFKPIDAQAGEEQLGLGMADAILTRLSKIPEVSVLPTTAVFKYSGRERDPVAAGRELGVDAVLDGTIQRSDGRVRMTAQLVRVSDGRTLWADKFDEPRNGLLALQDSVSDQVARSVAPHVGPGRGRFSRRYSENADAYDSYLMGFFFWNKRNKENIARAIPYLQRAVESDPDFALARAILADCYFIDAYYGYNIHPAEESFRRARAEASRALSLDDTLTETHIVLAQIKAAVDRDAAAAEAEFRRALELNPNYSTGRIRYGLALFYAQRLDEALRETRRGQELDPLAPAANSMLCFMLIMARDYDGAIKYGRRALELDPHLSMARVNLGEAYLHKGMYREAFDAFGRLSEDDPVLGRQCLALAHARAGAADKARALLSRLKRPPDSSHLSALDFAAIHAALGERDAAFAILEGAALDAQARALLRFDPTWDALRPDQRFEGLIGRGER